MVMVSAMVMNTVIVQTAMENRIAASDDSCVKVDEHDIVDTHLVEMEK